MHKLKAAGVDIPTIYVCDTRADAATCRQNGIPYVVWHGSDEELIKLVFYPTLKKMFPHILWNQVLGISPGKHDPGINYPKDCKHKYWNSGGDMVKEKLTDYVGDLSHKVNVDQLQDLNLLPKFIGDIADNIRQNYDDYLYWEGWNKKLDASVGNYEPTSDAMNLIIIDVSMSIPFGIAATMLSLADTMRTQANAGLIITGGISLYFDITEDLPSPQELRRMVPRCNEGEMFSEILHNHIVGKKIGNIICFGDNDCPEVAVRYHTPNDDRRNLTTFGYESTSVERIWSYHVRWSDEIAGYCKWAVDLLNDKSQVHYDNTWCNCIDRAEEY